jgi:hypothetical protein
MITGGSERVEKARACCTVVPQLPSELPLNGFSYGPGADLIPARRPHGFACLPIESCEGRHRFHLPHVVSIQIDETQLAVPQLRCKAALSENEIRVPLVAGSFRHNNGFSRRARGKLRPPRPPGADWY